MLGAQLSRAVSCGDASETFSVSHLLQICDGFSTSVAPSKL